MCNIVNVQFSSFYSLPNWLPFSRSSHMYDGPKWVGSRERNQFRYASHLYLTVIFCFKATLFGLILAQIGLITSILNSNLLFLSSVWFYYCSYWFVTSKLDLFHHTLTTVMSIPGGVSFYYIIDLFTYIDSSFSVS